MSRQLWLPSDGKLDIMNSARTKVATFDLTTSGQLHVTNANLAGAALVISGTADVVLTSAQGGAVVVCTKASGNQHVTLPDAASATGKEYTIVCGNVLTGMTLLPGNTTAVMHAKTNASGTAIASTANTGSLVNTQATAVLGDRLTVVSDGTNWWSVEQSGIFAAT